MHQVIATPQDGKFAIYRPGSGRAVHLSSSYYGELAEAVADNRPVPAWFVDACRQAWILDVSGQLSREAVIVRPKTQLNYSRATWEINKFCNLNCKMCYLPQRPLSGLDADQKGHLLEMLREAGVVWLQITGGEPTVDPHFPATYRMAYEMGMMLDILTNGTRLHTLVDLFRELPPNKVTVSVYGATAESFDALTRTRGAFKAFMKGLDGIKGADVPLEMTILITKDNACEVGAMRNLAHEYSSVVTEYGSISPTYDGGGGPLAEQAEGRVDRSAAFAGCPAGHTFFHVDPHGLATMCKVGRDNPINLMVEGLDGLLRLPGIADAQMLRTGGCSGCRLSKTCRVCRPMAKVFQQAEAPLSSYCQHGMKEVTA
ncbi:Radical SAM superfamily enzyme, MoaA/NifB/PqqE/SkfB family [Streptomyces sp. yr375]|uniref:radical SAM protein n=1 Tax=Streptomyces sp. yr375 TaxID=1761906 RepID=UPI0008BAE101|nr:radical SAM protein [Streptomyces sp. yr375]SEQ67846.1 Radical SAM superfamily enzyme, MoaA/NifB/PqqE/SkfB family [Streptomyces sp. yr375]